MEAFNYTHVRIVKKLQDDWGVKEGKIYKIEDTDNTDIPVMVRGDNGYEVWLREGEFAYVEPEEGSLPTGDEVIDLYVHTEKDGKFRYEIPFVPDMDKQRQLLTIVEDASGASGRTYFSFMDVHGVAVSLPTYRNIRVHASILKKS